MSRAAALPLAAALAVAGLGVATSDDLRGVVDRARAERWPAGQVPAGQGFAVASGFALTNAHVVAGCRTVQVEEPGRRNRVATVVGFDARIDAALLQVAGAGGLLAFAAEPARPGEVVVVLTRRPGAPSGGIEGRVAEGLRNRRASNVAEISAELRPGDSGAPVVNAAGRVAGMVVGTVRDEPRAVLVPAGPLRRFLAYHEVEPDRAPPVAAGGRPAVDAIMRVTCRD